MRNPVLFAGPLLAALLIAACGGDDDGPTQQAAGTPVPEVRAIEEAAEDAIDMVFAGNWDKVGADADSIEEDWQTFLASPAAEGVTPDQKTDMDAAIASIREAVRLRDGLVARQGANDVSKVIIDVFDLFQVNIPTDVGRLDYLERQVIIDAELEDWDTVSADLDRVRQTFDKVRADVETAGGAQETQTFDQSLGRQEQLAASHDLAIADEATAALELVDDLERVY